MFKRTYGSHKDIDRAIEKLKNLYRKYADQYSSRIFNLEGFENRYWDALKNKINLNAFLPVSYTHLTLPTTPYV